jgi:hypothetical protein
MRKAIINIFFAGLIVLTGSLVNDAMASPAIGEVECCWLPMTLQVKDQDEPWGDGVTNTWHTENMAPGEAFDFSSSFVGLKSDISGAIGIACAYNVTEEAPVVEPDADKQTNLHPDTMAKYLEITRCIYKCTDWQIDCLSGQISALSGGGSLPNPQAGWRLRDGDNDGTLTLYDLKAGLLSGLPLLSSYIDGMRFEMSVRFLASANNRFQGDTLTMTMSYTLTASQMMLDSDTCVSATPNPSTVGQSIRLTARVSGWNGTPTGTVTFKEGNTIIGTADLSSGTAVFNYSGLSAGTHTITASYAGDSNYKPSSGVACVVVQPLCSDTTTALTLAPNPAVFGQTVSFKATVSSPNGTPTGTVTFKEGSTTLGTAPLVNGTATLNYSGLCAGTHSITARYAGDSSCKASSCSSNITIKKIDSATTLTGTPGPSVFGQAAKFTATVSAAGGTPSGTVTFKDGNTSIGTASLSGGKATLNYCGLTAGTHTITAVYGGSTNYNGSTSASVSQVVSKADTSMSVTSSSGTIKAGKTVTFTATINVLSPGGGNPGGMITFMDGTRTIGTSTLSCGKATLNLSSLARGTHTIKAVYGGDGNFNSSTSGTISQVIS